MEYKGTNIRFIDLENELTFEAGDLGRQLYVSYAERFAASMEQESKQTDESIIIKGLNNVGNILSVLKPSWQIEVLALITTLDDKEYSMAEYDERIAFWKSVPLSFSKQVSEEVKKFIDFFTGAITDDLNTLTGKKQETKSTPKIYSKKASR